MDESGSIQDNDFVKQKNFVADLANSFTNFGPNGMQMAVITYSTNADLDIRLNQYSNKNDFINAVKRIRHFSKEISVFHLDSFKFFFFARLQLQLLFQRVSKQFYFVSSIMTSYNKKMKQYTSLKSAVFDSLLLGISIAFFSRKEIK